MCGIAGVVMLDGSPAPVRALQSMVSLLDHRGPDDRGVWSDGSVALGATRLKVIDLSQAAHQPMISGDGTTVLAYNGEVYNYMQLRDRLAAVGSIFRSRSDTEVVLEAWRQWGRDGLAELDGMFALALWDTRSRSLVLARDAFGIKPLYYAANATCVSFASEARALLLLEPKLAAIRSEALEEYLTFRDVAGDLTLFHGIERLLPGQVLELRDGRVTKSRYGAPARAESETTADIVERSVRDQMVADVPVGTLCSGGIDSGLVTCFAARARSAPVHAFSVSFPGSPLDESRYASAVARRAGAEHHILPASPEVFADDIHRVARHNDEPLKYENSVLLYQLCALAREKGVIVLLSGEGADEIFGGYPHFAAAARLARVRFWDAAPVGKLRPSAWPLPARLRRACYLLLADSDDVLMYSTAFTSSYDVQLLLGHPVESDFTYRRAVLAQTRGRPLAERMRAYDLDTYLPPILIRQDKASMAASVETRVPFLGRAVVDHALNIPARRLVTDRGKAPLVEVARGELPAEVIDRRKVGFSTPMREWIRASGRVKDLVSVVSDGGARIGGLIDQRRVRSLLDQHLRGVADHAQLLWTILALELWIRECCSTPHVNDTERAAV